MNSYTLSKSSAHQPQPGAASALKRLVPLMRGEGRSVTVAFVSILITSISSLLAPLIIGYTVDTQIGQGNFTGVLRFSAILLVVYAAGLVATYIQTQAMGGVGRRVLFALRNALFTKLQELPLDFFNQNKAGDLISRINNDTDKLNQFFSQSLVQLAGNLFMMAGAALFLVFLNPRLGLAALTPALAVLVVTRVVSPWVKKKNVKSLQALGGLSG
jgi:ATP-binding cassette subfamily B protein